MSLVAALPFVARAQRASESRPAAAVNSPQQRSAVVTPGTSTQISAESAPYHLEWNGSSGTLTRSALGNQPEVRMPLLYLHSEPGPKGHAKYLAWFLARDRDRFSLVWCYLDDSGQEFFCWLYQFPNNQLTTLRFVGDYHFAPGAEPVAPSTLENLTPQLMPSYNGPEFKYRDWTRRGGKLDQLKLTAAQADMYPSPPEENRQGEGNREQETGNSSPTPNTRTPEHPTPLSAVPSAAKTLTNLRIYPLHEIHVATGNGWRAEGWRELHALAYDAANDPYYLILYSNVNQGYVVDLKRAQTFVADFGQKVDFASMDASFTGKEEVIGGPPETRIRRFTRMEIPLTTSQSYDNPFTNVDVYMDFRTPDGKRFRLPGFWDGGKTWRVRLAPTQVGAWSWRSSSNDPELTDQSGSFTCTADDSGNKGFLTVAAGNLRPHTFTYANGSPFLPVFLHDPVYYLPLASGNVTPSTNPAKSAKPTTGVSLIVPGQDGASGNKPGAISRNEGERKDERKDETKREGTAEQAPASYAAFTRRVDDAAALGFNRFWGAWILDPVLFDQHKQANEGGAPFTDATLETINPAYFQWMDRRLAYCNEHGIVPDIGLTDLSAPFFATLNETQLTRVWRYALARYASFNICWNLFGKSADTPFPPDADAAIVTLAKLTQRYDPYGHPLTTVVSNAKPLPSAPPAGKTSGPPVIFTPDRPRANGKIPMLEGTPVPAPGTDKPTGQDRNGQDRTAQDRNGAPGRGGRGARNRNRGGSDTAFGANAASDSDYVIIVDPQLAANIRAGREASKAARLPAAVPVVRYGGAPWLNVITLSGGDIGALSFDYTLSKPLVVQDTNADSSADATRFRLWETVMRGGFWAGSPSATPGSADSLDNPIARWELAWAKLFRQVHYQRLVPHQDMLGGPEESLFERRRRKRAVVDMNQANPQMSPGPVKPDPRDTTDPKTAPGAKNAPDAKRTPVPADSVTPADIFDENADPDDEPPPVKIPERTKPALPGPIYVLADPGWEYVVYFQRGGSVTLDLLEAIGKLRQIWYNPRTGQIASEDTLSGGLYRTFATPDNKDWVLYLTRR